MSIPARDRNYLFISNVDINNRKGGWDGLGGKIFDLLSGHFKTVQLLDKINPGINFYAKAKSKIQRKLGLKADFPAFSDKRLREISKALHENIDPNADYLIFHGSTPWIQYEPKKQYCAILDCSFVTYMQVYHPGNLYNKALLDRVRDKERFFFERAHRIFFTSDWALQETRREYKIDGKNFTRIGQGPSTTINTHTPKDVSTKNQFLFIGTDFVGKGGVEICNSFQKFIEKYPQYELVIVGQRPPIHFLEGKNVRYLGFINKSIPQGEKQLEQLYLESKALLLMTRRDIAPLVVIEAGLHGCPSIVNNFSALSEMVKDGETGFLINHSELQIENAMLAMAEMNEAAHRTMRDQVQTFMNQHFTWDQIIRKMIHSISETAS